VTGNLTVSATGNVSQAANTIVAVGGEASLASANGSITLANANAFAGTVDLAKTGVGTVTLVNNRALTLGAVNIAAGNLAVTAAGDITQAANTALSVGGAASFNAANGSINLSGANALVGAVSLINSGANHTVTLTNNRAIVLGSSNVAGNLAVTAYFGNVTKAANATLTFNAGISVLAVNGTVTL
jgi:hypothetical protein